MIVHYLDFEPQGQIYKSKLQAQTKLLHRRVTGTQLEIDKPKGLSNLPALPQFRRLLPYQLFAATPVSTLEAGSLFEIWNWSIQGRRWGSDGKISIDLIHSWNKGAWEPTTYHLLVLQHTFSAPSPWLSPYLENGHCFHHFSALMSSI